MLKDSEFFEYQDLMCWITPNDHFFETGWGNGYVAVPKNHLLYKSHYDYVYVDVHGGLTYSGIDKSGEYWMFGFDTCHLGDNKNTWPKNRVKAETLKLAKQLAEFNNSNEIHPDTHCEVCGKTERCIQCQIA